MRPPARELLRDKRHELLDGLERQLPVFWHPAEITPGPIAGAAQASLPPLLLDQPLDNNWKVVQVVAAKGLLVSTALRARASANAACNAVMYCGCDASVQSRPDYVKPAALHVRRGRLRDEVHQMPFRQLAPILPEEGRAGVGVAIDDRNLNPTSPLG